jgi:hypothetical protein
MAISIGVRVKYLDMDFVREDADKYSTYLISVYTILPNKVVEDRGLTNSSILLSRLAN